MRFYCILQARGAVAMVDPTLLPYLLSARGNKYGNQDVIAAENQLMVVNFVFLISNRV